MIIIKAISVSALAILATVSTCNNTIADNKNKEDILSSAVWKLEEVARNSDCTNTHYIRGGINTTGINYGNIRIEFYKNGSGRYTTDINETYPMTWELTGKGKRAIKLTVDYGNSSVYNWIMVEITPEAVYNTTAYSDNGEHLLVTARYIPAK